MASELDALSEDAWPQLYRARGDEVTSFRPILTGDVFEGVRAVGQAGDDPRGIVIIVDHPCAFRRGVELQEKLAVYTVRKHTPLQPKEWRRHYKVMPLPDLYPDREGNDRHYAVDFTSPEIVHRDELALDRRVATLDPLGINLLQQRFMHHKARVIVETFIIQEAYAPQFEEADLNEEWCEDRTHVPVTESAVEFAKWMDEDLAPGTPRRDALKDPQLRSRIRQGMKQELKALRAA